MTIFRFGDHHPALSATAPFRFVSAFRFISRVSWFQMLLLGLTEFMRGVTRYYCIATATAGNGYKLNEILCPALFPSGESRQAWNFWPAADGCRRPASAFVAQHWSSRALLPNAWARLPFGVRFPLRFGRGRDSTVRNQPRFVPQTQSSRCESALTPSPKLAGADSRPLLRGSWVGSR